MADYGHLGVQVESIVFEMMLQYCGKALIRENRDQVVALHLAMMEFVSEFTPNSSESLHAKFPLERVTLRLLKPLADSADGGEDNIGHDVCDQMMENAKAYHEILPSHVGYILRVKTATSFDTLYSFLRARPQLLPLVDKDSMLTIISSICFEKHRTDHEDTLARIVWATELMNSCDLPLTAKQEKLLREYNLLEVVLQSMVNDANVKNEE